jgi:drug/metabolite transporter (DMT)-like permease
MFGTLAALFSTVASAGELVVDKILLGRRKLGLNIYLPFGFLFLFLFTLILTPFFGQIDWQVATLTNSLFLVFLMVVISVAWNALFYQSIQKEKVHNHELIMMLAPLITILLAAVFFPENFDKRVFYLAIVVSVALIFAKGRKEHFFVDKTSYNTFLGVILMSTESIIIRELLYSYSPVALYAIRTLFITLFFFVYYRPKTGNVSPQTFGWIAFSSLFGLVQMLGRFYAYQQVGIIFTTLIAILGPIIVFLASWEILHEKIKPRVIFAALIILACVVIATALSFG